MLVCPPLLLWNLVILMRAGCLGGVLSLVTPDPRVILATVLFSCQFGFLVRVGGSHLGGGLFWVCCLDWFRLPSLRVWLAVPCLLSLCALHVHCSIAGVRCFAWSVYAGPGLLALQGLGVLPFSFFSGLFCSVFPPDSVALLSLFWRCLLGVLFSPWPSLLLGLFSIGTYVRF